MRAVPSLLAFSLACTANAPAAPERVEAPPLPVPASDSKPASDAAPGLSDADKAEADAFIAAYRKREQVVHTDVPSVVFVTPYRVECRPMPQRRPADFQVQHSTRGYEPDDVGRYGVAAEICEFDWANFHLPPEAASCAVPTSEALDALYARLRELDVTGLRVRKLDHASPHRGGPGLVIRWDHAQCLLRDAGRFEVHADDRSRFDSAVEAFRATFDATGGSPAVRP